MKHTISVLVDNKPGVLARISGLFSARGFNIKSLAVGETNDPTVSRMTIIVDVKEERILQQIQKQLHKLIDVISVSDFTKKKFFAKELVFLKVDTAKTSKAILSKKLKKFSAAILSYSKKESVIEAVGTASEIKELLEILKKPGVKEMVQTGTIAIA